MSGTAVDPSSMSASERAREALIAELEQQYAASEQAREEARKAEDPSCSEGDESSEEEEEDEEEAPRNKRVARGGGPAPDRGVSFAWKLRKREYGRASSSIKGAILVDGERAGSVEGTIINRNVFLGGIHGSSPLTFHCVADEVSS